MSSKAGGQWYRACPTGPTPTPTSTSAGLCAKLLRVCLELVTADAAGMRGKAGRIREGSAWCPNLSSFQCRQVSAVQKREAAQSFCCEPAVFLENPMAWIHPGRVL